MAVLSGSVRNVHTLRADPASHVQVAEVQFTISGTYAQADNAKVADVHKAIQDSRRNGKTVTLLDAMLGQPASKNSDPTAYMSLKTVAVSSNDVTFEITDNHATTELADAATPAQDRPFSILVAFSEAD